MSGRTFSLSSNLLLSLLWITGTYLSSTRISTDSPWISPLNTKHMDTERSQHENMEYHSDFYLHNGSATKHPGYGSATIHSTLTSNPGRKNKPPTGKMNRRSMIFLFLLLSGDIEVNPGPVTTRRMARVAAEQSVASGNGDASETTTLFLATASAEAGSTSRATEVNIAAKPDPLEAVFGETPWNTPMNPAAVTHPPPDDHDASPSPPKPLSNRNYLTPADTLSCPPSPCSTFPGLNENYLNPANMYTIFEKSGIHMIHLNVNSLIGHSGAKLEQIREMFRDCKAHFLTFSETKLDDSITDSQIEIENYSVIRNDRNRNGGGVCMYVRNNVVFITRPDLHHSSLETVWVEVILERAKNILIGTVYRPPDQSDFYDLLEESLAKVDGVEKHLIGDWNTDMLRKEAPVFRSFSRMCDLHGLSQLITHPTRVNESSQTIIDLVVTTDKSNITTSGAIVCGLSDHYMIYCTRKIQKPKAGCHKTVTARNLKTYSSEAFNHKLANLDWSPELESSQVDEAWLGFKSKFLATLNTLAPLRTIRVKARSEPWMNSDILDSIKLRDKKFAEARECKSKLNKHPNHDLETNLKELQKQGKILRNRTNALVTSAKKNHISDKIDENINKPRELWKLLNSQLKCSQKLKTAFHKINILFGNDLITKTIDVAHHLNNHFTTIASTLVDKLPSPPGLFGTKHIIAFYRNLGVREDDFKLSTVTTDEVFKKLSALHQHKATGHDKIPPKFLRDSAASLAPIIAHIINLSIKQGHVPQDFKLAKVTPLHKKGSKLDPGNYRPISILSSISKIMEKIVYEQVTKYLEENRLIYEFQSGFRSSHSTDTCLLYLTDRIKHEVDSGKYCGMVMLDLQKAFDTVNHSILINKLKALGFDKPTVSWMRSYLEGREQVVEVSGTLSSPLPVSCGVPQGSILGPLLFLIYVNDMVSACECNLFLFADDSALLVSGRDIVQVENTLSSELSRICAWLSDNKLSIHLGKTESILFGSNFNLKRVDSFSIKVGDNVITRKNEITYLGCILEANLSSDAMTSKVIRKISHRTRFLYRIAPLVNKTALKLLARALIQPFFDYGVHIWYRSASKALKNRLQTAQNKLVRLQHNLPSRAHLNHSHFVSLGWLTVADRVQHLAMGLVYKIHYTTKVPMYLTSYFKNVKDVHSYNTRGSSTDHVQPRYRSNKGLNSFSYYAAKMWNALPKALKECKSLPSFKNALKSHLQLSTSKNWLT